MPGRQFVRGQRLEHVELVTIRVGHDHPAHVALADADLPGAERLEPGDFGALVGGSALLTEVVFALQGVGKLTYDALQNLDLPVIMATVMYASFFVVMANALVDILYATLDPRVRLA